MTDAGSVKTAAGPNANKPGYEKYIKPREAIGYMYGEDGNVVMKIYSQGYLSVMNKDALVGIALSLQEDVIRLLEEEDFENTCDFCR